MSAPKRDAVACAGCVRGCVGCAWGVRGACVGRAWGVRGTCVGRARGVCGGAISVGIARSALLSGYLGKSGHLPRSKSYTNPKVIFSS